MSESRAGCKATGIVIADAAAKMNSVTISTGIRLHIVQSPCFRGSGVGAYFERGTSIVHVGLQAPMIAEIQLIFKIVHVVA